MEPLAMNEGLHIPQHQKTKKWTQKNDSTVTGAASAVSTDGSCALTYARRASGQRVFEKIDAIKRLTVLLDLPIENGFIGRHVRVVAAGR